MANFDISEDFVSSPLHKGAGTALFDFDGLLQPSLQVHQDSSNGNGGQVWDAGVVLAKYLLRTKRYQLKDRSILELGSGSGLVGLAVTLGCQPTTTVHITDQQPMLALMQRNVVLSDLNGHVVASVYDWGEARPQLIPPNPDVILAADCMYFEPAFPLLQRTLLDLIGPKTVCYFCFKKRRRADLRFIKAAKKKFVVEPVHDDPDVSSYSGDNIVLCTIRMKPT